MKRHYLLGLLLLISAMARADQGFRTAGGTTSIEFNQELLEAYGLELSLAETPDASQLGLRLSAPAGLLRSFIDGNAPPLTLRLSRQQEILEVPLTGVPLSDRLEIQWRDAQGAVWLNFQHFHSEIDLSTRHFKLRHADVLIGPALAAYLGNSRYTNQYLGAGTLSSPLVGVPEQLSPSQCSTPTWPSPTLRADVALTGLFGLFQTRCDGCDGPGNFNGRVVAAPSALLKNVGPTDVPWYAKFSGNFPPYGNDQHPFLVWAMYRQDGAGVLRQIGRSGVKHAFYTINADCDCNEGQILGMQCVDLYSASTNDTPSDGACEDPFGCHQGPRSELVPSKAQWGRCGSIYDGNCDADPADFQHYTSFEHRMLVPENELSMAPGARWRYESWYLIRDDDNWQNNIGFREVQPFWMPSNKNGFWEFNTFAGAFENGTALSGWYRDAAPQTIQQLQVLNTPEGKLQIAMRVEPLPPTRWRYQLSVQNVDFARATTSGAEPNLRVLDNHGVIELALALPMDASLSGVQVIDADDNPTNEWSHWRSGGTLFFTAPVGNSLDWGMLHSFIFETELAPGTGLISFRPSAGTPVVYLAEVLMPVRDVLLQDGFE